MNCNKLITVLLHILYFITYFIKQLAAQVVYEVLYLSAPKIQLKLRWNAVVLLQ